MSDGLVTAYLQRVKLVNRQFFARGARISGEYNQRLAELDLCSVLSKKVIGSPVTVAAYRAKLDPLRNLTDAYKKNFEIFTVEWTRQIVAVMQEAPPEIAAKESAILQQTLQRRVNEMGLFFESMEQWIAAVSTFLDLVEPEVQVDGFIFEQGCTQFRNAGVLETCRPLLATIDRAHKQQTWLQQQNLSRVQRALR